MRRLNLFNVVLALIFYGYSMHFVLPAVFHPFLRKSLSRVLFGPG